MVCSTTRGSSSMPSIYPSSSSSMRTGIFSPSAVFLPPHVYRKARTLGAMTYKPTILAVVAYTRSVCGQVIISSNMHVIECTCCFSLQQAFVAMHGTLTLGADQHSLDKTGQLYNARFSDELNYNWYCRSRRGKAACTCHRWISIDELSHQQAHRPD